jgi:uncharacterized protein YndB with AHSA1/START domain
MKFTTREDIDLPIEEVFAHVSDLEQFERAALRRGIIVRRSDETAPIAPGTTWTIDFKMRGKDRQLTATLLAITAPDSLSFAGRAGGIEHTLLIDLTALSRKRTRLAMDLELKPRTLSARLMIQSFKLAKANLTKRFKKRAYEYAREIEKSASRVA